VLESSRIEGDMGGHIFSILPIAMRVKRAWTNICKIIFHTPSSTKENRIFPRGSAKPPFTYLWGKRHTRYILYPQGLAYPAPMFLNFVP
jgi:hypothetical protein